MLPKILSIQIFINRFPPMLELNITTEIEFATKSLGSDIKFTPGR